MSRTLHQWIALRRERRGARARLHAIFVMLKNRHPDATFEQAMEVAFRADFEAYRLLGHSLTGLVWLKDAGGPMPRYRRMSSATDLRGRAGRAEPR